MSAVETTLGPVEANALGTTLVHEHLHVGVEGMRRQWPHLYDAASELDACVRAIRGAQRHGVQTICDPVCMDLDRDVRLNIAVSEATGMRFVMASGAYLTRYRNVSVFLHGRLDLLKSCFIHDLRVGIQGTDIKAGFLKCAADKPGITRDVEMVHRAVARASVATGAPIMAHTNPLARTGLEQMRLFADEGVPAHRVQLAHTGDTDDVSHIERLLATGCYVGMDRYGMLLSTSQRNATVAELVKRGWGHRIMLSHDSAVVLDGRTEEMRLATTPDNHIEFLFETVLPALSKAGVDAHDLAAMTGQNVHRWLSSGNESAQEGRSL